MRTIYENRELVLPLPPRITHPAVAEAATTYREHHAAYSAAWERHAALVQSRSQAETDDRQALADAIRGGKKEPTTKHVDALEEDIAAAERRADALYLVACEDRAVLVRAVEQHRDDLRVAARDSVRDTKAELADALIILERRHRALQEAHAELDWAERAPNHKPGASVQGAGFAQRVETTGEGGGAKAQVSVTGFIAGARALCADDAPARTPDARHRLIPAPMKAHGEADREVEADLFGVEPPRRVA